MSEIIEVEAVTLDDQITKATEQFRHIQERIARKLDDYADVQIVDLDTYRDAKRYRADINALAKEINDAKKNVTRGYKEKIAEFDAAVKAIVEPLDKRQRELGDMVEAFEAEQKQARHDLLRDAFADAYPALASVMEYETLDAQHRTGAASWYAASVTEKKALAMLAQAVDEIAQDEHTIDLLDMSDAERQQVKADYFATLNVADAIKRATERREAAEREAERVAAVRELEQARADAQSAAVVVQAVQTAAAEPKAPQNSTQSATQAATPDPDEVATYVITANCTAAQARALGRALTELGIHGGMSRTARELTDVEAKVLRSQAVVSTMTPTAPTPLTNDPNDGLNVISPTTLDELSNQLNTGIKYLEVTNNG